MCVCACTYARCKSRESCFWRVDNDAARLIIQIACVRTNFFFLTKRCIISLFDDVVFIERHDIGENKMFKFNLNYSFTVIIVIRIIMFMPLIDATLVSLPLSLSFFYVLYKYLKNVHVIPYLFSSFRLSHIV